MDNRLRIIGDKMYAHKGTTIIIGATDLLSFFKMNDSTEMVHAFVCKALGEGSSFEDLVTNSELRDKLECPAFRKHLQFLEQQTSYGLSLIGDLVSYYGEDYDLSEIIFKEVIEGEDTASVGSDESNFNVDNESSKIRRELDAFHNRWPLNNANAAAPAAAVPAAPAAGVPAAEVPEVPNANAAAAEGLLDLSREAPVAVQHEARQQEGEEELADDNYPEDDDDDDEDEDEDNRNDEVQNQPPQDQPAQDQPPQDQPAQDQPAQRVANQVAPEDEEEEDEEEFSDEFIEKAKKLLLSKRRRTV